MTEHRSRLSATCLGRAVIAMTAVRSSACDEPGNAYGRTKLRPPTDVMAITSLPADSTGTAFPCLEINSALNSVLYADLHAVLFFDSSDVIRLPRGGAVGEVLHVDVLVVEAGDLFEGFAAGVQEVFLTFFADLLDGL